MAPAVSVTGLRDLQRAFAKTERDIRLGLRGELRQVAEPIRSEAEQIAAGKIPNIGRRWPRMRTGVTRSLIYVAPRQKGIRGRSRRSRPNLADLLMDRAMEPALEHHRGQAVRDVERMLDRVCDRFNRGGPL